MTEKAEADTTAEASSSGTAGTDPAQDETNAHLTLLFDLANLERATLQFNTWYDLEQDWDTPHGFAMMGARTSELLIMPGETRTLVWEPQEVGVYPF